MYESTVATPVWMAYLPKYVDLYYVGYDSNLDEHHDLLQKCIQKNEYTPLTEKVYDFWDCPEDEYLDEIRRKMFLDGFGTEYEEAEDEIKEWLWEHDESNPVEDLLRNTSDLCVFYSLGIDLDHGYHYSFMAKPHQNQSFRQSANRIRQALGIKKGTTEDAKILELCESSNYGGELRIYFTGCMKDYIFNDGKDYQTIKFKGKFQVAVWSNADGAGDFVELELDREFPFIRENLQISDVAEKYDIESTCGLCGDWLSGCDKPSFSYEKPLRLRHIKKSEAVAKELHFQKVFDDGGCSCGDCNINRHRNVEFSEYGFVCHDCGRTWYD